MHMQYGTFLIVHAPYKVYRSFKIMVSGKCHAGVAPSSCGTDPQLHSQHAGMCESCMLALFFSQKKPEQIGKLLNVCDSLTFHLAHQISDAV
jgi:hypothetical protein